MTGLPLKRLVFIISTTMLIFAALFAENFVFNRLDHDCEGGHCPVCLQRQIIRNLLEALRRGSVIVFLSLVTVIKAAAGYQTLFRVFPVTPVLLKVKSST